MYDSATRAAGTPRRADGASPHTPDGDPGVVARDPWHEFAPGRWQRHIDLRDFLQRNVRSYGGEADFLTGPTARTAALRDRVAALLAAEREAGGVLDVATEVASSILAHAPGYIDRERELVVGLQTDAPLKRAIMPQGGLRMVEAALEAYGFALDPALREVFRLYRKDHNTAVFDAYTAEILACRRNGVVTGLPDAYGRGRIVGDYRRVPLYGVARLIGDKRHQKADLDHAGAEESTLRLREELAEQIRALEDLSEMARRYGFDIDRPAATAHEAVQWLYFAYLGAVKEQNGAAMSLGRVSSFLDVYIERDLAAGRLNESAAQELIDDLVLKLRLVRFLRPPEYNALFSGDPTWVTECLGGMSENGGPLVTRSSYRFLQTLHNLGPAPEPNLTVLWSADLPVPFKRFCAGTSIATSALQYQNDDLMRPSWGDDYGIACCVSAMKLGKQMQFFGARANLAKALLYALNGGRDEITGEQVAHGTESYAGEVLDYDEVMERFERILDWLARVYSEATNTIHAMHDRYSYERLEMALHDRDVFRTMAYGAAGLSVVADSLSAIRYATVRPVRDPDTGLIVDFATEGEFPAFGNNDARVDEIAVEVLKTFMGLLRRNPTYRDAEPTLSVPTIASNVLHGRTTGSTPDGRKRGQPFAPGANPMHGRDHKGALAAAASVARLPYEEAQDGIGFTFSIAPPALGAAAEERTQNLVALLDEYFALGGQHIEVNVLNRDALLDAMARPEAYPQLTVRLTGYAVNFVELPRDQQEDVVSRSFHGAV